MMGRFNSQAFSKHLKQERMRRGWSQADVADKISTDTNTISRWERGIHIPGFYARQKLLEVFGVTAEAFGLLPYEDAEELPAVYQKEHIIEDTAMSSEEIDQVKPEILSLVTTPKPLSIAIEAVPSSNQSFGSTCTSPLLRQSSQVPLSSAISSAKENPFTYGNSISDPERFVGRRREAEQVFSRLCNVEFESSSLVGERRIGKTSLLNYLSHPNVRSHYGLDPWKYLFIYVDLQMVNKDTTPVRL